MKKKKGTRAAKPSGPPERAQPPAADTDDPEDALLKHLLHQSVFQVGNTLYVSEEESGAPFREYPLVANLSDKK